MTSTAKRSLSQEIAASTDDLYRWLTPRLQWARHSWLAGLALVAISLFLAWPDFTSLRQPESWPERAMDWKIDHPFERIPVDQFAEPGPEVDGAKAHLRKRTYRITVPLAAHWMGLHMRGVAVPVFGVAGVFLWLLFLNARRLLPDDVTGAFLTGLTLAGSFIAEWALNDFFHHDAVGYALLAAACLVRSPWLIAACVLAGGFTDERVIPALGLLYLLRGDGRISETSFRELWRMNRAQAGIVAGLAAFLVLRLVLAVRLGHAVDTSIVGFWYLDPNLLLLPTSAFSVFKGTILLVGAALAVLALRRSWEAFAIVLVAAGVSAMPSLLVGDIERSLAYSFPLVFVSMKVLLESCDRATLRPLLVCAALFSILVPTYYSWAWQMTEYRTLPWVVAKKFIHGLRHPSGG